MKKLLLENYNSLKKIIYSMKLDVNNFFKVHQR